MTTPTHDTAAPVRRPARTTYPRLMRAHDVPRRRPRRAGGGPTVPVEPGVDDGC